ncbi:MAG: hypothetical protein V7632_4713 [Bradyrhizobium sp.]|jgi:hypothetical protein
MSVHFPRCRNLPRAAAAVALLALAAGVSGCAQVGDALSPAFSDPAMYDLYDCKQLETSRQGLVARAKDQEALMEKAKKGVGGTVVSEMVYRNELISIHSQQKRADEAWRVNKCTDTPPDGAAPAAAPAPTAQGGKPPRPLIR